MNKLISTATFFKKASYGTYSWNGNEEKPRRQIDHIIIPQEEKKRMINCETGDEAGVMSDHQAVKFTLSLAKRIPTKKYTKPKSRREKQSPTTIESDGTTTTKEKKRIDWSMIPKARKKFNTLLSRKLSKDTTSDSPEEEITSEELYETLSKNIEDAAKLISDDSENTRKRPPWFEKSKELLLKLIEDRNKALSIYEKDETPRHRHELKESRSQLKRGKETAQTAWLNEKVEELELMNTNDPRTAWKSTKEIASGLFGHHTSNISMKMKKKTGEYAKNDLENAHVFKDHFEKLYNNHEGTKYDESILDEIEGQPEDRELGIAPTQKEIRKALGKMAYEKSPGPNGIPTEAFKNLDGEGYLLLEKTIEEYWNNPQYEPEEFTKLRLSILPKSGDLSNPNKWRGIALGDICAKTISSILANRLTKHLAKFGIDEQCGSLFGKGCADATFTLKSALQTLREHQQETHVLFVDLVKAYDSVNRELLWKVLKRYGIPDETITVLKKLHKNVTYIMSVGEEEVEIEGSVGVKQGDNLGPILFIYLIQAVATTMDKKWTFATPDFRRHGSKKDGQVKYNPSLGKKVSIKTAGEKFSFWKSFYVDDAAFLFLSRKDIEEGAKLIQPHFARFGLTVHCGDKRTGADSKTEAMFIPAAGKKATDADTADIYLNDHEFFGYCNKFKYLGTIFTPSLKDDADINKRITSAVGAFATMKKVLCNSRIPVKLRVRIFDATVVNILLWGCESWALTAELERKLKVCHNRFLRKMVGITIYDVKDHHISMDLVREELGNCYEIKQSMELRRARWLEKLSTMSYKRGPRQIFCSWVFDCPRRAGRQQQQIKHSLSNTLIRSLHFDRDNLNDWMIEGKNPQKWAQRIEQKLQLTPNTYKPLKLRKL